MSAAELDAPHPPRKPGDLDAVTFAWADRGAELYGEVRLAATLDADGLPQERALAAAFAGRELAGTSADGVTAAVEAPLERWSVRAQGALELALDFEATTPPAELSGRNPVTKAGGLEGFVQLCRVRGTVAGRPVRGLGQRDRTWGRPEWDKIALARSVGAWLDDGTGVALVAVRPAGAQSHADEASWAVALGAGRTRTVEDPRLSTTTDAAGRQIRAGLELWIEGADEYPFRGNGERLAGAPLELGGLRLQCAFFRWHVDGHTAAGRYDVLRRA